MSNFPNIINNPCLPTTAPIPDPRCSDPAFALAHPDICYANPVLILKPAVLLTCILGSVQFKAFVDQNGVETELTSGVVYSSSDTSVALVGAISGNATGVGSGTVTITASWQGITATARLEVMAGNTCCDGQQVATMLVVDVSKSMSLSFGNGYPTKLDYAKTLAATYAGQTNIYKDTIGLVAFDQLPTLVKSLTSDASSVVDAITPLIPVQSPTGIGLALQMAITQLESSSASVKTIVLFSDGQDKDTVVADDPSPMAAAFKAAGGIIICVGVRAQATGFHLLNSLSTGGFFLNGYPATASDVNTLLDGLKGYICAGNCGAPGDAFVHKPELDYQQFANWVVTQGHVDLFGPGLFDLLPGHGLYVSLASNIAPYTGQITSKETFNFVPGRTYRLSFWLAGNQRLDLSGYSVQARIGDGTILDQTITMPDFEQDFTPYNFNFTVLVASSGKINFTQLTPGAAAPVFGSLLDNVLLEDVTDLITLFSDDFDSENLVYVPPKCGSSITVPGYYGYNCYGYGCLTSPPAAQAQDPNPQADIEAGYVPPTLYTATRSVTVYCPDQFNQTDNLVPEMTSSILPEGAVFESTQAVGYEGFHAFNSDDIPWIGTDHIDVENLGYEFAAAQIIVAFGLQVGPLLDGVPITIQLLGSADGISFTALMDVTPTTQTADEEVHFIIPVPDSYLFYKLEIPAHGTSLVSIQRLKLFGVAAAPVNLFPVMISDTLPSGTVTADSETPGHEAWRALGDPAGWISERDSQITYQFPAGQVGKAMALTANSTINNLALQLDIFGSNDNINFDRLISTPPTATLQTGERRVFNFDVFASYTYYQLSVGHADTTKVQEPIGLQRWELLDSTIQLGFTATATQTSLISLQNAIDKANAAALAAANVLMQNGGCIQQFKDTEMHDAECPPGSFGDKTTASATRTSYISLDDARTLATAAALAAAEALLNCSQSNNTRQITINDNTSATPYPSVSFQSGLTGVIVPGMVISILGLKHTYPADIRLLLVAPSGESCILMQGCGNNIPLPDPIDLIFSATGSDGPLPDANVSPLTSGNYQPTQYGSVTVDFALPAPLHPYGTDLSVFDGLDANGAWALWVVDVKNFDIGFIANGWTITIPTA